MINMIFWINTELKRRISIVTAIILFVLLLGCEIRNAVIENQSTFDTVSDSEMYNKTGAYYAVPVHCSLFQIQQ